MPYLEFGGSLGANCAAGQPCDRSAGSYKGLRWQRRTEKLFHGVHPGDGEATKDRYTGVWWTEDKSADLTDPDTLTDFLKVTDKLPVQYKGQACFVGVWLRMRQCVSERIHRNGLNQFKRPYNACAGSWPEPGHSTPPADPSRYRADNGLAVTLQFVNGLYTVDDAAFLEECNNASCATFVRHYPLNEDDGGGFVDNPCNSLRPVSLSDAFDAKLGWLSVAVEREGPYSMISEARALAHGNPVNISYLEPSSMSRGFPGDVRRFNQALLSLPALPLSTASGMSDNTEVVVRKTTRTANGTCFAVINPGQRASSQVSITFPAAQVKDLQTQTTHSTTVLRMDLYPGEVRTFLVP